MRLRVRCCRWLLSDYHRYSAVLSLDETLVGMVLSRVRAAIALLYQVARCQKVKSCVLCWKYCTKTKPKAAPAHIYLHKQLRLVDYLREFLLRHSNLRESIFHEVTIYLPRFAVVVIIVTLSLVQASLRSASDRPHNTHNKQKQQHMHHQS